MEGGQQSSRSFSSSDGNHDVMSSTWRDLRRKNFALFFGRRQSDHSPRQRSEERFIRKKMIYYIIDYHKGAFLLTKHDLAPTIYRAHMFACVSVCCVIDVSFPFKQVFSERNTDVPTAVTLYPSCNPSNTCAQTNARIR